MREHVTCALCAEDHGRPYLVTPAETLVRCSGCGLVYVNPRPPRAVIEAGYEEEFFLEEYRAVYGVDYVEDAPNIRRIARERLGMIERFGPRGSLLDVGCAAGFLLDEARQRGWTVQGVEVSRYASRHARDVLRLPVVTGTLESAAFPAAYFDAAACYYVLEHLPDPLALMQEVARVLRPRGLVSVAVPNLAGLYARLRRQRWLREREIHRGHLYEFTPRTLRALLERAGFQIRHLTSDGRYARSRFPGPLVRRLGWGNVLIAHAARM
jgi:SAM-dependent methyltransferase